jgi:hypothetical protein
MLSNRLMSKVFVGCFISAQDEYVSGKAAFYNSVQRYLNVAEGGNLVQVKI